MHQPVKNLIFATNLTSL